MGDRREGDFPISVDTYGECQVLSSKKCPESRIVLKEHNLTDEGQFNKLKRKYEMKQKFTHENILNISKFFYTFEQQLCGQFFKLYAVYDCPQATLLQLINKGKVFSEEEIWDLLLHTANVKSSPTVISN